jgi:hypothetical protein
VEIELGWSTKEDGPWEPIPIDPSEWEDGNKLTRNSQKQMRFLATVDFPPSIYSRKGTPVYIRAVRNTMMHINGYKDRVYLSAIRTRQYNPKESDRENLVPALNINPSMADKFCRMGIQLKVNKNTEDNLDKFNVIATMTGRVWDKTAKKWSTEKVRTSNPAAVALEVLTGLTHNASKFADSEIDLPSFGRLYEYCQNKRVEVEDEGTVTFDLECNGVLTTAAKKSDVLKEVLAVCDAGLYVNEFGKKIVYYDDYQTTPIALLNPQRIVTMGETRNFDRRAEGYKVEFINEDADWATDTHRILRPFVEEPEEGYKYSPIKFVHVTGYYHAMWLARRMMAKEVHRPGEVKVSVGKEGRFFAPGSLLKVQHEGFKHGIGSGEIIQNLVKDGMVIGLRTMEKFNLSKDRDYFVDWYVVDDVRNHVVTRQIQSTGEYTNELLFTTPQPMDGWGDITPEDAPAMFNIVSVIDNLKEGTVRIRESKRYLVSDLSETERGYDLTLVQYHENVYETGVITPYFSSIKKSNPLVLSPHVDTEPYDGANGKDGETPYIGDNGNWWVGDEDTGVGAGTWHDIYRGDTLTADTGNTGYINGRKVEHGNFVMYSGPDTGTNPNRWLKGYMYQWNEIEQKWTQLSRPDSGDTTNGWRYNNATWDVTDGKGNAEFMNAYIRHLQNYAAFIEYLFARVITLREKGYIQSEATDAEGKPLFYVDAKGNGRFHGHIEASSGELDNIIIKEGAIFLGTVNTGPVFISNETTAPVSPTTHGSGTLVMDIVNSIGAGSFNFSSGSYGTREGLITIITTRTIGIAMAGVTGPCDIYTLRLLFNDGGAEVSFTAYRYATGSNGGNSSITQKLSYGGSVAGKIFRIDNLPAGSAGLPAGTVYRNGNNLCIV